MTKIGARLAAAVVAAVAGIISYGHIRAVALSVGESDLAAALLPIGVDGLIVVATLAMLEDSRAGRHPRASARIALGFGVAATIAGNIGSAEPTWTARMVAAVPAISFLIAVEVLARTGKPRDTAKITNLNEPGNGSDHGRTQEKHSPVRATESAQNGGTRGKGGTKPASERVKAAFRRTPDASNAAIASRLSLSERTVQRYRPPHPSEHSPNGTPWVG